MILERFENLDQAAQHLVLDILSKGLDLVQEQANERCEYVTEDGQEIGQTHFSSALDRATDLLVAIRNHKEQTL
jgi:hypothetical protein